MRKRLFDKDVYVIAEIGGNHEGNFEYAKKLLMHAIGSGAHAAKFQTYKADSIVSPIEGPQRNKHFKKFELTYEHFEELAKICVNHNVDFMTSFWDKEGVDRLDHLVPAHKIGSGDMTNYPLIKHILLKNKPLIISTAMSNINEVHETVEFIKSVKPDIISNGDLYILHCVAMYGEPKDEYAQLNAIRVLQSNFPEINIGYSDHTKGMYACELATALGANVIEKHFTDNKSQEFRDHHISATKKEIQDFMTKIEKINLMMGKFVKKPVDAIETRDRIKQFRRAVYPTRDILEGEIITEDNITTLRPNVGIDAREYYTLIGKKANKQLSKHHKINFDEIR